MGCSRGQMHTLGKDTVEKLHTASSSRGRRGEEKMIVYHIEETLY